MHWLSLTLISLIFKEQFRDLQDNQVVSKRKKNNFKPHMKTREILIIEELLRNLKPKSCLEWGSGYSTLYFPKFLIKDSNWLSIEHSSEWADKVKKYNKNQKVKVVLVHPNVYPWTDSNNDGSYSDLKNYVDFPKSSAPFDFILIDGRSRPECIKKAKDWISGRGIVALHDSNRKFYHENLAEFPNQVFFHYPGRDDKGLGLWLGSKGKSINAYLNIIAHKKLWKLHNSLRRKKKI